MTTTSRGRIDLSRLEQRTPSVDVVIPCYNYARYLPACVQSALDQPGVRMRVLIIDDCSSDNTPEVGQSLAAADPRVEYRRHAVNMRHIATYNEGLLGWASADYCVLLSADDMLVPSSVSRAVALMEAHPEVGLVYGSALYFTDDHPVEAPAQPASPGYQLIDSIRFLGYCCSNGNPVPTPSAVVRTHLQQSLGGYNPALPHAGDMEMWMRFATQGPVGVIDAVQALYRWHGGNMSSNYYAGRAFKDRRERIAACEALFAGLGSKFAQAPFWLRDQRRRFGNESMWWAADAFEKNDVEDMRQCLAFAHELHPSLISSAQWWRFTAKRLVGHGLLRHLQPAWNRLRGIRAPTTEPAIEGSQGAQPGTRTGWWPEAV
jgi:glycosyltransferase involved in cell wall biosynthesis